VGRGAADILSRRQLYDAGVSRSEVRANLRAHRWARVGRQCICVHRGPLTQEAQHWSAVFEAGPRAYLDGGSALIQAGLKDFTMDWIRVSVPRGAKVWRARGLDIRQTRRWQEDDLAPGPLRRVRVDVAVVRHALWARSNREAALVLTMAVQQGLTTPHRIGVEMLRVRRDKRRGYIHGVILDLLGGIRSLGELDFAREARSRGLPEPDRQVLRRGRNGRYYIDVYWQQWNLVVEIDGIQQAWVQQIVGDAIRQNDSSSPGAWCSASSASWATVSSRYAGEPARPTTSSSWGVQVCRGKSSASATRRCRKSSNPRAPAACCSRDRSVWRPPEV